MSALDEPQSIHHAKQLGHALTLATTPPLSHLQPLDSARARLRAAQKRMSARLSNAYLLSVFGDDHNPTSMRSDVTASISDLNSASPSQLALALRELDGDQAASNILQNESTSALISLFRDALHVERSSTAPIPVTPTSLSTSFHVVDNDEPSVSSAQLFVLQPHERAARRACSAVFRRVFDKMQSVLERLCVLGDNLKEHIPSISEAVLHVWRTMQSLLSVFLQTLLNLSVTSSSSSTSHHLGSTTHENRITLLPSLGTTHSFPSSSSSSAPSWPMHDAVSVDAFAKMLRNVSSIAPSIYNLEVIHGPLHKFLSYAATFEQRFQTTPRKPSPHFVPLPVVVRRAAEHFLRTVQHDVKFYMQHSFGPRAGTLLQPYALQKNGFAASDYSLPLLSQSEKLIGVISSCLSMAAGVPTVSERLGLLIDQHVIMPFLNRAVYALNLAASWTDAGTLLDEILTGVELISKNPDGSEMRSKTENESNGKKKRSRRRSSRRPSLLKTLRKNPQLILQCMRRWVDARVESGAPVTDLCLLANSEWNAAMRLIISAQTVIKELEQCVGFKGKKSLNGMQMNGKDMQRRSSKASIHSSLANRGVSTKSNVGILKAVEKTVEGCCKLKEQVIERGLAFLHAEVTLQCFSSVVQALIVEGSLSCNGHMSNGDVNGFEVRKLRHGTNGSISGGSMRSESGDERTEAGEGEREKSNAETSAIFKVSTLKISVGSGDASHAKFEYDEFGDRIMTGNEGWSEADAESEHGFPGGALFEAVSSEKLEWKQSRQPQVCEDVKVGGLRDLVSERDRRTLDKGHEFGAKLKERERCMRQNFGGEEAYFIVSQADGGVALGIGTVGRICAKGDRDVAVGAKLFLDAAAGVAADTMGWPVAETDFSVAEGISRSARECRTLLYAAGML
ncbi:hypothetical protein FGB62_79g025 [Gracilaria domingensis]|nr:hypothetical protein FGB62_79g025 [Gracilaria domingensis]